MLNDLVLVLNCGSSSVRFSVLNPVNEEVYLSGLIDKLYLSESCIEWTRKHEKNRLIIGDNVSHFESLHFLIENVFKKYSYLLSNITAIGHRVVHGGMSLNKTTIVNKDVIEEIKKNIVFAPLHNPINLLGIQAALEYFPHLSKKNVIVLDTAFYKKMPESSYLYAIPYNFYKKYNIRRYGAHGISHYYVVKEAAKILNINMNCLNVISCHLGGGSSVTVFRNGICVDTSMGLTPLEGLVMGTRSGDIDPSIIFFLNNVVKMSINDIQDLLMYKSGILGLNNGITSDFRYVERNYQHELGANRAINIFCHRLSKYISSYTTLLNGKLDGIIFTGGIGANSSLVRRITLSKLSMFGIKINNQLNNIMSMGRCGFIERYNTIPLLVIPTNEELVIAKQTIKILKEF
ncbi:Acetate kinase [Buchnera aphidicola (Pterocallis alni)]|uniref:acetate kinase n=1 Tax=Buchnera aphidicola TaxID=9 RepID=UPI003464380C